MKWFKHFSDAYSNIKHQQLIAEFGLEIYAFYWICLELVAQQGANFEIDSSKKWKTVLKFQSHLSENKVKKYLEKLAEVGLIDENALKNNNLSIPKMSEYSDQYTERVRRKYVQSTDKVPLEVEVEEEEEVEELGDKSPTPADQARNFFTKLEKQGEVLSALKEKYGQNDLLTSELKKFIDYWTELNKSGTKQRWEQQPTFEIKRRLTTWLNNIKSFNKKTERKIWN